MGTVQYHCRICGFLEANPPWGEDGKTPEFDYCACCGVEHGYQDSSLDGCRKFRARWIANGARWLDDYLRPTTWQLEKQLADVPAEFV